MIAIDPDLRLFYEGASFYGHAIWPSPVVSLATVINAPAAGSNVPEQLDLGTVHLIFREDSYDPVTRIRRGRFYNRSDGSQPQEWRVQQHPAFQEEVGRRDHQGYLVKRLFGFHVWPARIHLQMKKREVFIALGIKDAMTLWRVVGVEQISTGEDLVTLKARSNLGVLPELAEDAVPDESRDRVKECLSRLVDTAYRSGPESIVDRCRDASAAILGAWLAVNDASAVTKELGKLAEMAGGSAEKAVVENAAKIIARLHARAKPNEQVMRGLRALEETDAELAIECVGVIMREIKWARISQ